MLAQRFFSTLLCLPSKALLIFHTGRKGEEGEKDVFLFLNVMDVCALTYMVLWVIKPSRWLLEIFETGQYWVARLL